MVKKTKAEQLRHPQDVVYNQWISRPLERRHPSDTDDFADDLWAQGPRMGSSQELHRQMVMDIIRGHAVPS